ncbi:MAG: sulfide/dihydroorotate dehydrogenase-like FAD/NAD-binding protein [Chloroflexi bacterium]|nr:sulfide/dihydroorotate dehydrogenase-like FAD/NAD-binding protein [Chloroflexota bacterium]
MFKILAREDLTSTTHSFRIDAPAVARKAQAGQFIILRVDEKGERIPLTLADWDAREGWVNIVFMGVGTETKLLATLKPGDSVADFVGPLGRPTEIERYGTAVCVAGGVGVAPVFPIARSLRQAGNRVVTVMGARCKDLLFWEDKLRSASDELIVTTDDGSYARKGVVTVPLKEVLERNEKAGVVIAIGPAIMMKFCAMTTKPYGVKTLVSLNPIMVDGTGMCGACRVTVGGQTRFACVDGPFFDAHEVNFDEAVVRSKMYVDDEKLAAELAGAGR